MTKRPSQPKNARRKRPRKPHNASPVPEYRSLSDVVEAIATQERLVPFAGGEVMMSRRERSFRIMIEKALDGQANELAQLLRLMAKYPELPATVVPVIIFRGGFVACNEEGPAPTTGNDQPTDPAVEADEVGYKRPPKRHWFKKGQKPPPRKKKRAPSQSPRKLLARLLAETRRAQVGDKIVWRSAGELVVHKAFEVAERSSKVQRLLIELQFQAESADESGDIMIFDPLDGSPPKIIGGDDYPDLARAYAALAKELPDGWTVGTVPLRICRDGRNRGG